eukprot:scpid32835/ scgid27654/ Craniofacial development protein 2; p97 bucentaur protein
MSQLLQPVPSVFSVSSFNVRGLSSNTKKQLLAEDLRCYKIQICSLQETKIQDGYDGVPGDYRIVCLSSTCRHYGNGFAIHHSLLDRVYRIWSESDRVAVLQIRLSKNKLLSLVSVYAPTSTRVAQDQDCLDDFYSSLNAAVAKVKSSSIFLVLGDFNAKLGTQNKSLHQCIGRYGRGRQNYSGKVLADYCDSASLFACSTAFQHPARHCTTWTGWRKNNSSGGAPIPIYNQIDYILCSTRQRQLFTDARSYAGTLLDSDHGLLVARMKLDRLRGVWGPIVHAKKQRVGMKIAVDRLSDPRIRKEYQSALENAITQHCSCKPETKLAPQELWDRVRTTVMEVASATLGASTRPPKGKWIPDPQLTAMVQEKRKIRLQLINNP